MAEIRRVAGAITFLEPMSFVLVRSKNGKWIFPKGGVEEHESEPHACEREAFEEAGVTGTLDLELFCSKKDIQFYILSVDQILEDYPEKDTRVRRLISIEEAMRNEDVADYVKEIIEEFVKRKSDMLEDTFLE